MASAAAKKLSNRGKRRTDARRKRVARPGAKPARGTPARLRASAKKRVAKRGVAKKRAKLKRALTVAVAKRRVKKRLASLKRTVAKGVARARTRAKGAKKRVAAAGKSVRSHVKAARKRVAAAGKSVRKRVSKGVKAAKRVLKRAVAKRAARPASARRAMAKASAPVPPAFAAQRAHATPREELMFELQRARASVKAATQGLGAGVAERPIAPGKWSIKEIVLHLGERDRVRLEEFSRTLGGQPRSWAGIEDPEMGVHNEVHLAPLRAHGWDDALRRLDSQREQLLLRLSEVPAEPDDVWRRGHPFADMMWGLPEHDRHHASQIKLARIGANDPVED